MANIGKRICEAWVGACVQRAVPNAFLWSPTFHVVGGLEFADNPEGSVLLQCGWVQEGRAGLLTRHTRPLIEAYALSEKVAPWHSQIYFIAVANPTMPVALEAVDLYAIPLGVMYDHVVSHGVGTVRADAVVASQGMPSISGAGNTTMPLDVLLQAIAAGALDTSTDGLDILDRDAQSNVIDIPRWGYGMNGQFPSPIAVSMRRHL